MIRELGIRAIVAVACAACRPAPPTHVPDPGPRPRPAEHVGPTVPTWRVSFARDARGVAQLHVAHGDGVARHRVSGDDAHAGPLSATESPTGLGLVATLGPWIRVRIPAELHIEAQATKSCADPWILDLDAPQLRRVVDWRGSARALAGVRLGCGPVEHAEFVSETGEERTVFYGATTFDARSVAGEIAVIRSTIEQSFGVTLDAPWRTEVVIVHRGDWPGAWAPDIVAVPRGIRAAIAPQQGWGAQSRLALAATIAAVWLRRQLGPTEDLRERAVLAGIARGLAREDVFTLGLVSPADYALDLDRDEATIARARRSARPGGGHWLAGMAAGVAVDAAILSWAVRERAGESIIARLRSQPTASPSQRWGAVVRDVLGTRAPSRDADSLPARALRHSLGPCIVARARNTPISDFGFDISAAPDEHGRAVILGVAPGGIAERAGLLARDVIVGVEDGARPRIGVLRGQSPVVVELVGALPRGIRRAWQRAPGIADERCYPT